MKNHLLKLLAENLTITRVLSAVEIVAGVALAASQHEKWEEN